MEDDTERLSETYERTLTSYSSDGYDELISLDFVENFKDLSREQQKIILRTTKKDKE
ncbi:hypothetical protein [Photobacterium kishitanii]|nr:hypothetical protein [Photobacterium kishitanii]